MAQMQATIEELLARLLGNTSATPQHHKEYEKSDYEDDVNLEEILEDIEVQEAVTEIVVAKVEEQDPKNSFIDERASST